MQDSNKPNILLFFSEQWRSDCVGYTSKDSVIETPFLDQLCIEGITFTNAYSACPTCIATRACLATGKSPNSNGRIGYKDGVPWNYDNTLMECLRNSGYQTINSGKTHFYPPRTTMGFEQLYLYDNQDPPNSDYHRWLKRETGDTVKDTAVEISSNSWLCHPWAYPEYLHSTNWCIDTAIDALSRRDPQRPFFLQVGFHRPHPPLDPPLQFYTRYEDKTLPPVPVGNWAEKFNFPIKKVDGKFGNLAENTLDKTRKAYYSLVTHADYHIGRLIHWLRREKLLDNTWIIFIADHGEMLGDHRMMSKINPFEGSAHVPFIVKPPGPLQLETDRTIDFPVTHMDVLPTLLDVAGIDKPGAIEGSSLVPFLKNSADKAASGQNRAFIHGEHAPGEGSSSGWQYATDGKEKYIWDSVSGDEYFFDLVKDPQELHNNVNDNEHRDRAAMWRDRIIDILKNRPEDGLTDGKVLFPGKKLPPVKKPLVLE